MVLDFQNKTVVVTGGANGIGLTTARTLRGFGANVWIFDLEKEKPEQVAGTFAAQGRVVDVTDRIALEMAFEDIPGVDVLVANAGAVVFQSLLETKVEDWNRVVQTNLTGVFHCVQLAAARMKDRRRG